MVSVNQRLMSHRFYFRMLSKVARRGLSSSAACAGRIKVAKPVVEMDGDEMTRIIWKKVKIVQLEDKYLVAVPTQTNKMFLDP